MMKYKVTVFWVKESCGHGYARANDMKSTSPLNSDFHIFFVFIFHAGICIGFEVHIVLKVACHQEGGS